MSDRFDKFTERARKALSLAQEEAQRFHHNYIGTEHILLGLVREGDGVAAKVLANLGVELDQVRSRVEAIIGRGDRLVMGEIGLTPRAKKVFELSVDEARRLDHHYIGTEHLLLGLVREGAGIGARVLGELGVSLDQVRPEVLNVLGGEPPTAEPTRWETHQAGTRVAPGWVGQPPFTLRQLLRVLPIAQSHRTESLELTLLSLEIYAEGFLLNGRVDREGDIEVRRWPEVVLAASDESDQDYRPLPCGGNGISTQWRFCFQFAPPLREAARELRIRVDEIRWRRPDRATSQLAVERTDSGPWTFTIPLQGT